MLIDWQMVIFGHDWCTMALCLSVALTSAIGQQCKLARHNMGGQALNLLEMNYTYWLDSN